MSWGLIIAGQLVGLAAALFISLFALDAFASEASFWQNLLGFAIHLIPSLVLVVFVALSWRWPLLGGALLLVAAFVPFLLLSNAFWVNASLAALSGLAGLLLLAGGLIARYG